MTDVAAIGMVNALCVDVDDLCLTAAESDIRVRCDYCGVEYETLAVLDHLDDLGVRATFFVPGVAVRVAPRLPAVIVQRGHQLASHGWLHTKARKLGQKGFFEDVLRSKSVLEDRSGTEVDTYKAPMWKLTPDTPWAYDELARAGFRVDHSAMPAFKKTMGMNPGAMRPIRHSSGITMIPPTVISLGPKALPLPGGFYGGYFPAFVFERIYRRLNKGGTPFNLYFHPFEHTLAPGNRGFIKSGSLYMTIVASHSGRYRPLLTRLAAGFRFDTLANAYRPAMLDLENA